MDPNVAGAAGAHQWHGARDRTRDGSTRRFGSASVALALAPRLPLALLAIGLIHVGILAGFTFLSVRLEQLGAEPSTIALSAGVSAFAEIPAQKVILFNSSYF